MSLVKISLHRLVVRYFRGIIAIVVLLMSLLASAVVVAASGETASDFTLQDLMNMEMVSSGKFKQDLSEVTASAYVITEEDIKYAGATDLPSLLKMVPGLFIGEATSSGWAMGIRGFNGVFSNKMLVMIDGRSLFSPLFSGVFWEQLDLFIPDIARIEVIRGVGSTVWGANAVNGIINIITKSTLDNKNSQFYLRSGSHTKYDVGLRFGANIAEQSYVRVYVKSKDINANPYYDVDGGIDDSWNSSALGVKWEHFSGRDSFVVSSDFIEQSIQDPSLITSRVAQNIVPLTNTNLNLSSQWQRQMSTDKAFTLSSQIQQNERDSHFYRIDDHMLNVDFDTNYKWQDHQILVGLGGRQHNIDFEPRGNFTTTDKLTNSETQARILSAYIQDEWRLNINHSLILGTKFESHKHTHSDMNFEYSANLWLPTIRYRFDVSENSRVWAAISRSARIPSISEHVIQIPLFTFPANSPANPFPWSYELFSAGNPEFDKEKILSFELGFRANIDQFNSIDIVAYHNQYEDVRYFVNRPTLCVVSGQPAPFCAPDDRIEQHNTFENIGDLDINGIEVIWLSRLSDDLNLSANYAYLNQTSDIFSPTQTFSDAVNLVPKHQVSTQLDWHNHEDLNVRFKYKYVNGFDKRALPLGQEHFLDHYHSLDIITVYELSGGQKLNFSVTNLLHRKGKVWASELPSAHVSDVERRFGFGIDVTF